MRTTTLAMPALARWRRRAACSVSRPAAHRQLQLGGQRARPALHQMSSRPSTHALGAKSVQQSASRHTVCSAAENRWAVPGHRLLVRMRAHAHLRHRECARPSCADALCNASRKAVGGTGQALPATTPCTHRPQREPPGRVHGEGARGPHHSGQRAPALRGSARANAR